MASIRLESSINVLYGIGKESEKRLNRLGIKTIYDLITYVPRRYEDWSQIKPLSSATVDEEISFIGVISSEPRVNGYSRKAPITFRINDNLAHVEAVFFNSPYVLSTYHRGDRCFFHGVIKSFGGKLQIMNPFIEKMEKQENSGIQGSGSALGDCENLINNSNCEVENMQLVRPVYPLTAGLTSKQLQRWIKTALPMVNNQFLDILPKSLYVKYKLPPISRMYYDIHFPQSVEEAQRAILRLKYEELILVGVGIKRLNSKQSDMKGIKIISSDSTHFTKEVSDTWNKIRQNIGFELTDDQHKAIKDIQKDISKDVPMNRLVQGDVGSGKTIVALLVMCMTALMGKQSVLLAPTSVLATQHYETLKKLLEGTDIKGELLLGKTTAANKKKIKNSIATNESKILIGTHALLSDDIKFNSLSLVITDEQHRFGVLQRAKLLVNDNNETIHSLVMTATPIPRTLGMIVYGDMDSTVIRQKPAGRQKILTGTIRQDDTKSILYFLRQHLENDEQVYIVCSRIDSDEDESGSDLVYYDEGVEKNEEYKPLGVKQMYDLLFENGVCDKYKIATLYGSMKENEKLKVMDDFINQKTRILISTTVIEVGVNNPNATVMLIMDADRFGLSTLHQLRGRVGRGSKKSYCVLASNNNGQLAKQRLSYLVNTDDGFELAEKDLELRGPGDFFGTKQHGIPELKAANLFTDISLAKEAVDEVNRILEDKNSEEYLRLCDNINRMIDFRFGEIMEVL